MCQHMHNDVHVTRKYKGERVGPYLSHYFVTVGPIQGFTPHPNNSFGTPYDRPSLEKKSHSPSLTLTSITNLSLSIPCTPIFVSMSQSPPPPSPPFAVAAVTATVATAT